MLSCQDQVQVETKAIVGKPLCLPSSSRFVLSIDNRAVLHSLQVGLCFRKSPLVYFNVSFMLGDNSALVRERPMDFITD